MGYISVLKHIMQRISSDTLSFFNTLSISYLKIAYSFCTCNWYFNKLFIHFFLSFIERCLLVQFFFTFGILVWLLKANAAWRFSIFIGGLLSLKNYWSITGNYIYSKYNLLKNGNCDFLCLFIYLIILFIYNYL